MPKNINKTLVFIVATMVFAPQAMASRTYFSKSVTLASAVAAPGKSNFERPVAPAEILTPFMIEPTEASINAALSFVRKTGLNKNLSLLLLDTMKYDGLVVAAIKEKGMKTVQSVVVTAIVAERGKFELAWDHILAKTYSQFFTPAQLTSLAQLKDQSPHFAQLISLQNDITARVNTEGATLLSQAQRSVKARVAADLAA